MLRFEYICSRVLFFLKCHDVLDFIFSYMYSHIHMVEIRLILRRASSIDSANVLSRRPVRLSRLGEETCEPTTAELVVEFEDALTLSDYLTPTDLSMKITLLVIGFRFHL